MNLITLDFETYYASGYSLGRGKLTTEEYINDDRFQVVGVSVKVNDEKVEWFTGNYEDTKTYLRKLDIPNSALLAHNTLFDGAILSWKFGIKAKRYLDTLCMARAVNGVNAGGSLAYLSELYNLGEKGKEVEEAKGKRREDFSDDDMARYGGYCKNDVELTHKLFKRLMQEFNLKELKLIDLTLNMYINPLVQVDVELLQSQLAKIRKKKERLLEAVGGDRGQLMSNPKFAELLRALGVEPPMKVSERTGKETYAFAKTDEGFIGLKEHSNVNVQVLVNARLGTKSTIEETRIERFIAIANRNDRRLPIPLKYYGTHTGRWSGTDKVNLQNLPSRDKDKATIKKALLPPDDCDLINCDSSQIEARVLAWLSGQDDLVKAFAEGRDVYKIMASSIYEKPVEDITSEERFVGKTVILGCGYGTGWKKLQNTLKSATPSMPLPDERCQQIIKIYREINYKIVELWRKCDTMLELLVSNNSIDEKTFLDKHKTLKVTKQGIVLPNSFKIKYPDLQTIVEDDRIKYVYQKQRRGSKTYLWGGSVVENVVQALARCIVAEQMLKVSKKYPVVLTVHDSVVAVIPSEKTEEAKKYIEECMSVTPDWAKGLPITCESGYGKSYGSCD
jgi:DNA polymerase I-like protein with 3'-5' exonuclease and polymerase domains